MPRSHIRPPSAKELRFCQGEFRLRQALTRDERAAFDERIWLIIVRAFLNAKDSAPRRPTSDEREFTSYHGLSHARHRQVYTDNYLTRVDPKKSDFTNGDNEIDTSTDDSLEIDISVSDWSTVDGLVTRILSKRTEPFIDDDHLCQLSKLGWTLEIDEVFRTMFIAQLQFKLMRVVAYVFVSHGEIWYDERREIWQLNQSSVDQLLVRPNRGPRKGKDGKDNYRNNRHWHGRVLEQSERRGIPGGTSIGASKHSAIVA